MTARRVHSTLILAIVISAASVLTPLGTIARGSSSSPLNDLTSFLARAAPSDSALVFVGASTSDIARAAIDNAGLREQGAFDRVGIVVAHGPAHAIAHLTDDPSLDFVELSRPIDLVLDTSHKATRGDEVTQGFTVPTSRRRSKDIGAFTGKGVSIAIIDTGIDGTHPFFASDDGTSKVVVNRKFACPAFPCPLIDDTVANDDLWLPAPNNDSDTSNAGGHGTHVAGVAAGRYGLVDGVIPVHGAAPDAALVALGIADNMVSFAGFAGMYWALEHHADPCGNGDLAACPPIRVVNNSWGLFDGTPSETEDRLQRALIAEGVTVVWAGGNDGGDGSSALTNIYARTPVSGSLLVAGYNDEDAGTPAGAPSWFSSRGKAGDQVTYPDVAAPADHIMSSCRPTLYVWCYAFDETLQYSNLSGTSLAAPHVAGIVAQLIEADPSLTPAQIETLLKTTAFPFAAGAAYEAADGGGKTSFDKGHGLVDAKAAIARLRGIKLPGRVVPLEYTCGPGGVIGTDPAEDVEAAGFTYVFTPEPALDLRGLSVRWDSNASALRFTISVEDLPAENPATTPNASWSVVFEVEDQLYFVAASRDFTGTESFGVGVSTPTDAYDLRVATAPASGELDPDQDTIDLVVSSEALQAAGGPPLEPGTILDRVRSGARRSILAGDAGDTAPFSDIGFAQCPVVVGEE